MVKAQQFNGYFFHYHQKKERKDCKYPMNDNFEVDEERFEGPRTPNPNVPDDPSKLRYYITIRPRVTSLLHLLLGYIAKIDFDGHDRYGREQLAKPDADAEEEGVEAEQEARDAKEAEVDAEAVDNSNIEDGDATADSVVSNSEDDSSEAVNEDL